MNKTLAVFALGVIVTLAFTSARATGPNERLFQDVLSLVSRKYVHPISNDSLMLAASRGLIDDLGDPYAHLYTADEMAAYTQTHLGRYGGIGMIVGERDGKGEVQHVYPKSPAGNAGLTSGDLIVGIDNEVIDNWPLEKITGKLRGEVGTHVKVSVLHEGVRANYDLTRAEIHLPAVGYDLKFGHTGYIPLTTFNETSAAEVKKAVENELAAGATSLVLDLRGNGGGLVDQAVAIADLFLKKNL
ncbi:MAG TPA: S41 family peptidase, partial [Longimicrobiales bacterium]|nr:S41 family peptidase [Longimicrobiales bacterium]